MSKTAKVYSLEGLLERKITDNFTCHGGLRAPRDLGGQNDFALLVDQLGLSWCANHLGVHRTTIQRWKDGTVNVPRHVVLALYWQSNWGRALIDSDHMRALSSLYGMIDSLNQTNKALLAALEEMEKHVDRTAANSPVFNFELRHYATAPAQRKKPHGPPTHFPVKPKR